MTFAEIIAPLSMAAFWTLLQQRKPCHVVGHARLARAPLRGDEDDAAVTETLRRALSDRIDRLSLSGLRQMHQAQRLNGE